MVISRMIFQNRSVLRGLVARSYTDRYYKRQGTRKTAGFGKLYPVVHKRSRVYLGEVRGYSNSTTRC